MKLVGGHYERRRKVLAVPRFDQRRARVEIVGRERRRERDARRRAKGHERDEARTEDAGQVGGEVLERAAGRLRELERRHRALLYKDGRHEGVKGMKDMKVVKDMKIMKLLELYCAPSI
jgi:hypothetical protein